MLDRSLAPYGEQDVLDAKQSLIEQGYQGRAYGHGAAFWADKLVALALDTMTREERIMFEPLRSLVYHRETLANMVAHFFPLHTVFDGNSTAKRSIKPDETYAAHASLLAGTFPSWSAACVCTYAEAGHALSGMWPPLRLSTDRELDKAHDQSHDQEGDQRFDGNLAWEHHQEHTQEHMHNNGAPTSIYAPSAAPVIGILPRYDTEFTNLTLSEGYITGIIACLLYTSPSPRDS